MNGGLRNSWQEWWRSLAAAPDALSARQRSGFVVAWAAVAISRLLFAASSPWDWDEMLFSLGVRQFDIALHHPHPPGFPLFIALGKLLTFAGLPTFRALQAIDLAGGMLLVPATFALCHELRFRYSTSLIAALFLAFFPNVWFFGETAFSDVPAVVLAVGACALLLRGCRDDRSFVVGALLLGAAAAFRPQNLVIGMVPALIATWYRFRARRWAAIASAMLAGASVIAASYGAAIAATGGWARYHAAIQAHREYITTVDSFRNPNRPPLLHLFDDFFMRPYHAPLINAVVTALAAIAVIVTLAAVARGIYGGPSSPGSRIPDLGSRWGTLIAIVSFGPFCLAAWLMLDHFSASRFSIGYAPLIAILSADGATIVSTAVRGAGRQRIIESGVALIVTVAMAAWTLPALLLTGRHISPPAQAMSWIRTHVKPDTLPISVHEGMGPYAEWFLPDYSLQWMNGGAPAATLAGTPLLYVAEGRSDLSGAINFSWPHDRAWNVARRRYFEVSIVRVAGALRFSGDWYDEERTGRSVWRWMSRSGSVELPPIEGRARLDLRIFVPLHVFRGRPAITLRMNGAVVREFRPDQPFTDLSLDFPRGAPAVFSIDTDRTVNQQREKLGNDTRDLGLRIDSLQWLAVRD